MRFILFYIIALTHFPMITISLSLAVYITLLILFLKWVKKAAKAHKEEVEIEPTVDYLSQPVVLSKEEVIEKLKTILPDKTLEYDEENNMVTVLQENFKKLFKLRRFRNGEIALQYFTTISVEKK